MKHGTVPPALGQRLDDSTDTTPAGPRAPTPPRRRQPASSARDLVDEVLRSFRTTRWSALSPESLSTLSQARAAFIAAGAERLKRDFSLQQWLQINLELHRGIAPDTLLNHHFARTIEHWIDAGDLTHFFFVSKAPGLRLRFCGPPLAKRLRSDVCRLLDASQRRHHVAGYSFGLYDSETYQFGGERGIELFHEFSTFDSLATIRLGLLRQDRARAQVPSLSLLMISGLLRAVTTDSWELWDIWRSMRLTGRHFEPTASQEIPAKQLFRDNLDALRDLAFEPQVVIQELPTRAQVLVQRYFERSQALGQKLREAEQGGDLLFGLRKILPFYIVFHWNRARLPLQTQRVLTLLMTNVLSPKREWY